MIRQLLNGYRVTRGIPKVQCGLLIALSVVLCLLVSFVLLRDVWVLTMGDYVHTESSGTLLMLSTQEKDGKNVLRIDGREYVLKDALDNRAVKESIEYVTVKGQGYSYEDISDAKVHPLTYGWFYSLFDNALTDSTAVESVVTYVEDNGTEKSTVSQSLALRDRGTVVTTVRRNVVIGILLDLVGLGVLMVFFILYLRWFIGERIGGFIDGKDG